MCEWDEELWKHFFFILNYFKNLNQLGSMCVWLTFIHKLLNIFSLENSENEEEWPQKNWEDLLLKVFCSGFFIFFFLLIFVPVLRLTAIRLFFSSLTVLLIQHELLLTSSYHKGKVQINRNFLLLILNQIVFLFS